MTESPSLAAIATDAWQMLERGAADPALPAHWPVLATIASDAEGAPVPNARTVVLRGADGAGGILEVHTDARSFKLAEIAACPRAMLVAYDAGPRVQLRVAADVAVHRADAVAHAAWQRLPAHSRAPYGAVHGPGRPVASPREGQARAPDEALDLAERFTVLRLQVRSIDWLLLDPAGHTRARIERGDGRWSARWLSP